MPPVPPQWPIGSIYPAVDNGYILAGMTKRLVDVDDDALAAATAILGAATMKEAVNRALSDVVAADRRRRHAARLSTGAGLELAVEHVMADAWRQ